MNINDRIKLIRIDKNMNQTEFAKKLGVTQPSLSDIEKGKTLSIDERNIKIICKEFNISESWLRSGEGNMDNSQSDFWGLIASKHNELDELDKRIITEYLNLSTEQRKALKNHIKTIFNI